MEIDISGSNFRRYFEATDNIISVSQGVVHDYIDLKKKSNCMLY